MHQKTILKSKYNFIGLAILLVTLLLVVLLFFLEFTIQKNDSMEPRIYKNTLNVFSKIQKISRGTIVVYKDNAGEKQVGRVIAMPSEDVVISKGEVYVNSEVYFEEYVRGQNTSNVEFPKIGEKLELKKDEFFIMGDNRNFSYDSRHTGPIKQRDIVGTLLFSI